jgi:hypothetical protein
MERAQTIQKVAPESWEGTSIGILFGYNPDVPDVIS